MLMAPDARRHVLTAARPGDASGIARLLRRCAPATIPVPESEIRRRHDEFVVVREEQKVIATAALRRVDGRSDELRSLAVDPGYRGQGLGERLVACLSGNADRRGRRLLCVTLYPDFFRRQGFSGGRLSSLPAKSQRGARVNGRPRVAMVKEPEAAEPPAEEAVA